MRNRPVPDRRPSRAGPLSGLQRTSLIALALATAVLTPSAQALEPSAPSASALPGPVQDQIIKPGMGLQEALQTFEANYRAPVSTERFRELGLAGSWNLMKDLELLNSKIYAYSKTAKEKVSLRAYVFPVPLSAQRLQRWKDALPSEVRPPQVSYQAFAVALNGKAYVVAPAHGVHGDTRYFTQPKSDTAVRPATEAEAKHAVSLEVKPSEFSARIITPEGKLLTGENVRFESAAVQSPELLRVLLPDTRNSFHNSSRGVEVDYERIVLFTLPPEWSHPHRLRIHRASGFSGAPAIEKTPRGDAVAGHFIGHHSIKIGNKRLALGIIEDHAAIRAAVEGFAAQSKP